jgi:hypothetical protein
VLLNHAENPLAHVLPLGVVVMLVDSLALPVSWFWIDLLSTKLSVLDSVFVNE